MMKRCAYCGRENVPDATRCAECGTDEFRSEPEPSAPASPSAPQAGASWLAVLQDDPVRLFRFLLKVSLVSAIASMVMGRYQGYFLSDAGHSMLRLDGYDALLQVPPAVSLLSELVTLAAQIGMFWFSAGARRVYLIFMVYWFVLAAVGGTRVGFPLSNLLGWLGSLATGAVLVMAYFTPLRHRFR